MCCNAEHGESPSPEPVRAGDTSDPPGTQELDEEDGPTCTAAGRRRTRAPGTGWVRTSSRLRLPARSLVSGLLWRLPVSPLPPSGVLDHDVRLEAV
ncbi:unnamed protein product [Merluccius merluccius]